MTLFTISGHGVAWFFGAMLAMAALIGGLLMIFGGLYLAALILDWFAERIAKSLKLNRTFYLFLLQHHRNREEKS